MGLTLLMFGRFESYYLEKASQISMDVLSPVLLIISRPAETISQWGEGIENYFNVFDDNQKLREETARLRVWRERALLLESRIAEYESLLNVQSEPEITYLTGRIISDSNSPFVHTVLINIGQNQGVENGQAVMDSLGLIGRIVAVGRWSSRVLLLTDLNSRIPVLVEPGNYHAILAGKNTETPWLAYLPADQEVERGNRVVTSGYGGFLPPGLPIGIVTESQEGKSTVKLFADLSTTHNVRILKYNLDLDVPRHSDN